MNTKRNFVRVTNLKTTKTSKGNLKYVFDAQELEMKYNKVQTYKSGEKAGQSKFMEWKNTWLYDKKGTLNLQEGDWIKVSNFQALKVKYKSKVSLNWIEYVQITMFDAEKLYDLDENGNKIGSAVKDKTKTKAKSKAKVKTEQIAEVKEDFIEVESIDEDDVF